MQTMPQTGYVRSVPHQDVLYELKLFISGATQNVKCNQLELTKSALTLLKTIPAARDAVLEYFCTVFNSATLNYISRIEVDKEIITVTELCLTFIIVD